MRSLPFFLILAFAAAAPAGAQIVGRNDYGPVGRSNPFIGDSRLPGPGIERELAHIREGIDRARDSGAISRREARILDREARLIGGLAWRYGRDGMSLSERNELQARANFLRAEVNRPRRPQGRPAGRRGSRG